MIKEISSPIAVKGERVWRTYIGGKKLDQLEGLSLAQDTHLPELWILSTVAANNIGREDIKEGKCYLKDYPHISLKQLIETYPAETLGSEHNKRYKGEMGVLVKLIDSQERLAIQVHPTKEKARQYFNSDYGKTECWHIIETRDNINRQPCVYIGFKEHVSKTLFNTYFEEQNLTAMLDLLHCVPVEKGDTFIIPGGIPHAIGAGCALIEIQEPTDYTLRVEKTTPNGFKIEDKVCHQGIGIEAMMDCFNFQGMTKEEILTLCQLEHKEEVKLGYTKQTLVSYDDTPYFQMEKFIIKKECKFFAEDSFYGLMILGGDGKMIFGEGSHKLTQDIHAADQFFIPVKSKPFTLIAGSCPIELIKFKGPK